MRISLHDTQGRQPGEDVIVSRLKSIMNWIVSGVECEIPLFNQRDLKLRLKNGIVTLHPTLETSKKPNVMELHIENQTVYWF